MQTLLIRKKATVSRSCRFHLLAALALGATACGDRPAPATGEEPAVNVYTHRHYDVDKALFARFTEETGIAVNVVTAGADELITRLEAEGSASPADVLITVDAGRLHRAVTLGLLQPTRSDSLEAAIPAEWRDPEGRWFGITRRARVIAYAKDRVDPATIPTYESLTGEAWRGKVLVRSSDNVYNQSLLAALIAEVGDSAATAWAAGVAANMARQPSGGDTDQLKAIAAGEGDVALVNTYYLARLQQSADADERRVGEAIGVVFPNQAEGDRGTHVNVSGIGITVSAPHPTNARRFIEFLVSDAVQRQFAEGNYEYPVKPSVAVAAALAAWGPFRADTLSLAVLGERNAAAVAAFDRAGWR